MKSKKTRILSPAPRAAFSLVELSVVIAVIALLVGGFLAGQGMVQSAKLRAITTDLSMYRNAITSFREKYAALPGDMPNATTIWGPAAGNEDFGVVDACADLTTASADVETCNGDGNGFIADQSSQYYEAYRAWQQLSSAKMIKGKFTGVSGTNRAEWSNRPDVNSPSVRLDKRASWSFRSFVNDYAGDTNWFPTRAGNFLMVGNSTTNPVINMNAGDPLFKPAEARQIDRKMDDGIPGSGTITTFKGDGTLNPNCTEGGAATDPYNADDNDIRCALVFRIDQQQ